MAKMKTEDKEKLKDDSRNGDDLHTEGPIAEKDEVKQAEDRTARRPPHDLTTGEKLKDDEDHPGTDKQ